MKEVAVGIILVDGKVLACQRRQNAKYPLKWEFPGGKIEPGETPKHALKRELHEELGIDAQIDAEFYRQEWVYAEGTDTPQRDGSFRVFYFLVKQFSGEPVNQAFEQIQWVRPRELAEFDILEGNKGAVELLVKYAEQHQTR